LAGVGTWLALREPAPEAVAPTPAPSAVAEVTATPVPSIATGPSTPPSAAPTAVATALPTAAPTRVAVVEPSPPATAPPATAPPATVPPATVPPVAPPTRMPATPAPRAAQLNALLARADDALLARNYDAAIAAYDEALALDGQSAVARQGRSTAIQARTLATATTAPVGKAFVPGKTKATSAETKAASAGPEGFETGGEVAVKSGTQVALLPGKVVFDVDPERVKPGDAYKVRIYLSNEGNAPIQVQGLSIATTINGKSVRGPVPPLAKDVAPRQRALLREVSDLWKEETNAWSMEATVRTTKGEVYSNQVTWQ
jgi:hypothetical protein